MNRILLALILSLTAASVGATTWSWQGQAPEQPIQYCKGLVVGGLASREVTGRSRTDLWLAWNYVIRSSRLDQASIAANEYQQGHAQFTQVADTAAATAVLQNADGNCGLGRSGHEITGW